MLPNKILVKFIDTMCKIDTTEILLIKWLIFAFPEIEAENNGTSTGAQTLDLIKDQPLSQKSVGVQSRSIGVGTDNDKSEEIPTCSQSSVKVVDGDTVIRRRSLVPMSSMEEENLRERLHLAHLRLASEIVNREQKYTREGFRRLLQSKVGTTLYYIDVIYAR